MQFDTGMEFKTAVRGYDREEVDAYIARLRRELDEARETKSPSGAVKRALEQVGDEVAGILKRAHETAAEVTTAARKEADERLESARRTSEEKLAETRKQVDAQLAQAKVDAAAITATAERRLRELDLDTDRIWSERDRIITDVRELARQLVELADAAAERFPPEDDTVVIPEADVVDEPGEPGLNGSGPAPIGPA